MSEPLENSNAPIYETGEHDKARSVKARYFSIALVLAVLGIGATGLLLSLAGGDNATGGSTPEDAFERLVQAINDEDALGIASLIELEEFGVVGDALDGVDADISGLPGGFDLTLTGLDGKPVSADFAELGGPDSGLVVATLPGAEIAITRTDGSPLGIGIFSEDNVAVFTTAEIDPGSDARLSLRADNTGFDIEATAVLNDEQLGQAEADVDDVPLAIVFIENDGRWYFSPLYTIAHLTVSSGAVDAPDYGAWRQILGSGSAGSDSPSGAVERLLDAFPTLDVEDGALAIDPIEAKLLHDFMPVMLDAIGDSRQEMLTEGTLEITALELSEEIEGHNARVFVDLVSIRFESPDENGQLELDGDWCYQIQGVGVDDLNGCLEDNLADAQGQLDQILQSNDVQLDLDLRDLLPERPFVATTQRDGRWYVSPLATVFAYMAGTSELAGDLAAQLEGQFEDQVALDTGVALTKQLPLGETTIVSVDAELPLAITPGRDQFTDLFGGGLAFYAVTITSDTAVDIQHSADRPLGLRHIRVDPDEPLMLVANSDDSFPRSQALVVHNRGETTATLSVDVRLLEIAELDPGQSFDGVLDDRGVPVVVVFDDGVSIDGAGLAELDFERFPWFEIGRPSARVDAGAVAFVIGDPGEAFTVTAR